MQGNTSFRELEVQKCSFQEEILQMVTNFYTLRLYLFRSTMKCITSSEFFHILDHTAQKKVGPVLC